MVSKASPHEPMVSANSLASRATDLGGLTRAAELSQIPLLSEELIARSHLFPEGKLDECGVLVLDGQEIRDHANDRLPGTGVGPAA